MKRVAESENAGIFIDFRGSVPDLAYHMTYYNQKNSYSLYKIKLRDSFLQDYPPVPKAMSAIYVGTVSSHK